MNQEKFEWADLDFWSSGEWQVVKEKLHENSPICPERKHLFKALKETPFAEVRAVVMGQDPYPTREHATGIAFDVPIGCSPLPPSLVNIFKEYQDDLCLPTPSSGSLLPWCRAGVLLWNSIPSCSVGRPASHHWEEWTYLTKEIVERLDARGDVVFCLLGNYARAMDRYITRSPIVCTSHPSPLGVKWGFAGSRIFSQVNSRLERPIEWRLP